MAAFGAIWSFHRDGRDVTIKPKVRFLVNDTQVAINAAVGGLGVIRLLSYQVATALSERQLTIILEAFECPPIPIHMLRPGGRSASPTLQAFVGLARKRLAKRFV